MLQMAVYYTGDKHGGTVEIRQFCKKNKLTKDDVIVILGDVGANYYLNERDEKLKHEFRKVKPTIFCIQGNHEIRPSNIPTYITKEWNGGTVWYEERFPKLLFAKDGEIFNLDGLKHLVIGGAYSVDKPFRVRMGYGWWPDEQPSDEIKAYVEEQIKKHPVDVILSHTCPYKYEPTEAFLPSIDQSTIDKSTEKWLDTIEESCLYKKWLCGHFHIQKRIDKLQFMYHDFISSEDLKKGLLISMDETDAPYEDGESPFPRTLEDDLFLLKMV